ncbi:hypothetical protein PEL8287_03372 [Roseovarius litorisediminis]|uniref:Thioredoxin domain-containing protein n=1 Tax=Roseovarius litorisediminis TaxID=1312363 RepID=A0A1Y5TDY6_9RHOB|nr:hypothetical protein [Roseovarius litorisediminis]SLN62059.1 hypothetical protein PEL8287_03372 [Roseovarius litorisediminis]
MHLLKLFAVAAFSTGFAAQTMGQTSFSALTKDERAILHEQIRAVLLANPELAAPALGLDLQSNPTPVDIFADAVENDLTRIRSHAQALFDPALPGFGPVNAPLTIALFIRANCPDCARAEADLRQLVQTHDLRVTLIDFDAHSALAHALELGMAPSYVLPEMLLRGHIPPIVLERYFKN